MFNFAGMGSNLVNAAKYAPWKKIGAGAVGVAATGGLLGGIGAGMNAIDSPKGYNANPIKGIWRGSYSGVGGAMSGAVKGGIFGTIGGAAIGAFKTGSLLNANAGRGGKWGALIGAGLGLFRGATRSNNPVNPIRGLYH